MGASMVGTVVVFFGLLIALLLLAENSDVHNPSAWTVLSKISWKNATVRPPLLIVLVVAGWGWVVNICHGARLEIGQVLGGEPQKVEATYHAALVLLCVLLAGHLVHFWASETPGVTWRPWLVSNCALNAVYLVLGLLPCNLFFGTSRLSLVKALWESAIAPFAPVTFWHVIVADYLTSLAKAFSDLQLTFCISSSIFAHDSADATVYVRSTEMWHASHGGCARHPANAIALALPFWMRLMQCLKVYSQTGEVKNLWNALKYSTAFPLVYVGYLKKLHPDEPMYGTYFVAAAVLQSTYCFIWDVHMDWGLFRHANLGGKYPSEKGSACCGAKPAVCAMREPLLISRSKTLHVMLCVFDLLLRFVWALSIFGGVPSRGIGMLFFECVEILRRTVWAIFRIEWEVVAKAKMEAASPAPATTEDTTNETKEVLKAIAQLSQQYKESEEHAARCERLKKTLEPEHAEKLEKKARRKSRELEEQIADTIAPLLANAFEEMDTDKSGALSVEELKEAFTKAGIKCEDGDVERTVKKLDTNNDGEIDLDEFKAIATAVVTASPA